MPGHTDSAQPVPIASSAINSAMKAVSCWCNFRPTTVPCSGKAHRWNFAEFPDPEAMRRSCRVSRIPTDRGSTADLQTHWVYQRSSRGEHGGDKGLRARVSDMEDNAPTQEEDRKRLVESIRRFGKAKSCMGFYYVSPQDCPGVARLCRKRTPWRSWKAESSKHQSFPRLTNERLRDDRSG